MSLDVFIGYDPREAIAFHTCVNSLIRHSSQPLTIHPLALTNLRYRETHGDGSNDFIYSRFLVPSLMDWTGRALYIDGDMVVTDDISKLFDLGDLHSAVQVVKHDYTPKAGTKYFGNKNESYPRKNWSSVILWNCWHFSHRKLTTEFVRDQPGSYLHRFSWIPDELIGELPPEWNWLDEYGENPEAKLIHWTNGIPAISGYANAPMAETWYLERMKATYAEQVM
jgi:hypothetical protein